MAHVRTEIEASGAWVIDVKLFSNMSVCFNFEIPIDRTERLREALAKTALHLTGESEHSFAAIRELRESALEGVLVKDIAGSLQITFVHNEPDLRIEVPSIPG